MAVKWVDRVPTRANRVRIIPEDGSAPYYAVMERADEPSVVGTPVNAANLNAMQDAVGLTENKTIYVATTGSNSTGDGSEAMPFATINHALSTIPKNLNGFTVTINIASGTYPQAATIRDFSNGAIRLSGVVGDTVTLGSVNVINTHYAEISNILIHIEGGHLNVESSILRVNSDFSANGGRYGIHVAYSSGAAFSQTVTITNTTAYAVVATMASHIYVYKVQGSGNAVGFAGLHGGICCFGVNESTATTLYTVTAGGRIFSGSQPQVPSY